MVDRLLALKARLDALLELAFQRNEVRGGRGRLPPATQQPGGLPCSPLPGVPGMLH